MIIMMKLEPSVSTVACIPRLVSQEKKNISKKLHQPFYIIVYISYNPFSKKVYGENLMLKIIYGMVTQTIAHFERFSINFSFYKQTRVNFVEFFWQFVFVFHCWAKKKEKGIVKGRIHAVSFCLY